MLSTLTRSSHHTTAGDEPKAAPYLPSLINVMAMTTGATVKWESTLLLKWDKWVASFTGQVTYLPEPHPPRGTFPIGQPQAYIHRYPGSYLSTPTYGAPSSRYLAAGHLETSLDELTRPISLSFSPSLHPDGEIIEAHIRETRRSAAHHCFVSCRPGYRLHLRVVRAVSTSIFHYDRVHTVIPASILRPVVLSPY